MSSHELERVEVMGRVGSGNLKLSDAAEMLELSSPGKEIVAAVSEGGQQRAKAWECGPTLESQQADEVSAPSIELDPKKIFGFGRGEIRPDLSGRALGGRRWHGAGSRHGTTLDVAGRAVEPATKAQETLPAKGAQSPLRGTGAIGREFRRLVGRAWSAGLPDGHGGRCHQRNAGWSGQRRDNLGGSRGVAGLD